MHENFLKYIKYSCVIFMQSWGRHPPDEKSVCAICISDLISASLIPIVEISIMQILHGCELFVLHCQPNSVACGYDGKEYRTDHVKYLRIRRRSAKGA